MNRDDRQKQVQAWCVAAFGADHATSIPQRALRFLEEAIELYQAAGASYDQDYWRVKAHELVDFIFDRPPGTTSQEFGGVGVTLLAFAEAVGLSADAEEQREVERVLAKPPEYFKARNEAKNAAGFNVVQP